MVDIRAIEKLGPRYVVTLRFVESRKTKGASTRAVAQHLRTQLDLEIPARPILDQLTEMGALVQTGNTWKGIGYAKDLGGKIIPTEKPQIARYLIMLVLGKAHEGITREELIQEVISAVDDPVTRQQVAGSLNQLTMRGVVKITPDKRVVHKDFWVETPTKTIPTSVATPITEQPSVTEAPHEIGTNSHVLSIEETINESRARRKYTPEPVETHLFYSQGNAIRVMIDSTTLKGSLLADNSVQVGIHEEAPEITSNPYNELFFLSDDFEVVITIIREDKPNVEFRGNYLTLFINAF